MTDPRLTMERAIAAQGRAQAAALVRVCEGLVALGWRMEELRLHRFPDGRLLPVPEPLLNQLTDGRWSPE